MSRHFHEVEVLFLLCLCSGFYVNHLCQCVAIWQPTASLSGIERNSETWNFVSDNDTIGISEYETVRQSLSQLRFFAYGILGSLIIVSGIIGNILNLVVLTRPGLKGVTYVYLFGLAVSDLGALISAIPMLVRLTEMQLRSHSSAMYYAHFELPIMNSFMACSIFIVVCLTVDRFISVCMPTRFKSVHTTHNAHLAITTCCILAVVVSLPLSLLKTVCKVRYTSSNEFLVLSTNIDNATEVYSFRDFTEITSTYWWRIYLWSSETIVRFGPTAVLALLNTLIIKEFRKLTEKRKQFHAASEKFRQRHLKDSSHCGLFKRNYKEERRLIVLLTSIVILFFVTTTPSAFLSIFYSEELNTNLGFQLYRALANNLELGNFALNFYIYFLCSKEFRKVFLLVFNLRRNLLKDPLVQSHQNGEELCNYKFSNGNYQE